MAQILPIRQPESVPGGFEGKARTRDYRRECQRGRRALIEQAVTIREHADDGTLSGDKWMYLVRVLLDCPLPYRPTTARQITRRTRVTKGWVSVIYTARQPEIELPFGADARLLHWLLDRAMHRSSKKVRAVDPQERTLYFECVRDFLVDCGMSSSGENYEAIRQSFRRLSGLGITINFEYQDRFHLTEPLPVFEGCALQASSAIRSINDNLATDIRGFVLSEAFYENGIDYCARIPREVWRLLKGRPQRGAMLLWLYVRQYAAAGPSRISWGTLQEQLSYEEKNPGRLRGQMREAMSILRTMWPAVNMRVDTDGIVIGKAFADIVPDDPACNRVRRVHRDSSPSE